MARRLDVGLPLGALIVSFVAVLVLGRAFATDEQAPGKPVPTTPQVTSPEVVPPSPGATGGPPAGPTTTSGPPPNGTRAWMTIRIKNLAADDAAPGVIQKTTQGAGMVTLCLDPAAAKVWDLQDAQGWRPATDSQGPCRTFSGSQLDNQVVIDLVRKP